MALTATEYAVAYTNELDQLLVAESITNDFEDAAMEFSGARTVRYPKITVGAGGNYNKATGFTNADAATFVWETATLDVDYAYSTEIDEVDNMDELSIPAMQILSEVQRVNAVPMMDKNFFTHVLAGAGNTGATVLTVDNIVAEIKKGRKCLGQVGVADNASLFMTYDALALLEAATKRSFSDQTGVSDIVEIYDRLKVVPASDAIATGWDFVIVGKGCASRKKKLEKVRVFAPDVNQTSDAYRLQYRLVAGTVVKDNKKPGIYTHTVSAG